MAASEVGTLFERITVTAADGLLLAGEVAGDASAPLVIFLHGGGQSRSAWRGAAARMAEAGYRGCTMDLRGHGESEWSEALRYGFDDYVGDLCAVIDRLGGPAVLVGASLGGHISLITAARYPDKARAIALADVTPWIDEDIGDAMRAALRRSATGFATLEEAAASVAAMRGVEPGGRSLDGLRRHLNEGEDGRFYWRWDVRLVDDDLLRGGGEGGLFQREAMRLNVPVLVMRAEHSTLTTPAEVEAFRAIRPDLRSVMIAGAGHMVTGDVNDAYADAILGFLGELDGGVGWRAEALRTQRE